MRRVPVSAVVGTLAGVTMLIGASTAQAHEDDAGCRVVGRAHSAPPQQTRAAGDIDTLVAVMAAGDATAKRLVLEGLHGRLAAVQASIAAYDDIKTTAYYYQPIPEVPRQLLDERRHLGNLLQTIGS